MSSVGRTEKVAAGGRYTQTQPTAASKQVSNIWFIPVSVGSALGRIVTPQPLEEGNAKCG